MAALARRLGVPFRSGGSLCASKIADAQAAYESAATLQPTVLGGVNFVLHAAGWLEGGLAVGYEKFIMDADQCGMMAVFVKGVDLSENGQALDAIRSNGPGQHFLGTAHTLANFETAFYRCEIADNNSFEQWTEDGSLDAAAARQRDLEADAAPSTRRRRSTRRSTKRSWSSWSGARRRCRTRRSEACSSAAAPPRRHRSPRRSRAVLRAPDLRAGAAQERARPGGVPAAGAHGVGDGVAGQGHRAPRSHCASSSRRSASAPCRTCRPG